MVIGESRRLARRATVATDMPTDFQSALGQVTGRSVDLRDDASPDDGWLKLVEPGNGKWMSFSAFGTSLFGVDLNTAAVQKWAQTIGTLEEIDAELAAGTYGLMDVRR